MWYRRVVPDRGHPSTNTGAFLLLDQADLIALTLLSEILLSKILTGMGNLTEDEKRLHSMGKPDFHYPTSLADEGLREMNRK